MRDPRSGCQHKAWGGAKRNPRNQLNRNDRARRSGRQLNHFPIANSVLIASRGGLTFNFPSPELAHPPFDACGVSTSRGHKWNDGRSTHMPLEIAFTTAGRRFFAERAAARDLALFVQSLLMEGYRWPLRRDPTETYPPARKIAFGVPRVVAIASPGRPVRAGAIGVWTRGRRLVVVTKAADGRRFRIDLEGGRIVSQQLGDLVRAH